MTRSNPFSDVESLFERMNRQFEEMQRRPGSGKWNWQHGVRVDLAEEDGAYVVTADLPGFEKEDIEVNVDGRTFSLSAHREHEHEDDGDYIRRERRSESVRRSLSLPGDVDAEGASASYKNGVLSVTIPMVTVDEDEGHHIDIE